MTTNPLYAKFAQSLLLGLLTSPVCLTDVFSLQDSNQDGVLSGREMANLQMLDSDGDGEVSRQEFVAAANEQADRAKLLMSNILTERDTNEDGRLSGKETQGLEHCDANNDGRITEAEIREALTGSDPTLAGKSISQIREIAAERFQRLDTNQDDRLTGTEAHGSLHFDQNADRRVVKSEYVLGVILSSASDATPDSAPNPTVDKKKSKTEKEKTSVVVKPTVRELEAIVSEFVTALNDPASAPTVRNRMHENLMQMIDPPIFEYIFMHAKDSHGAIELPPGRLETKTNLETGEIQTEVKLQCQRGQLTLVASALKGKTTSFALNSPEMLGLDKALYRDLQGDQLQQKFAETYGEKAQFALSEILDGNDDEVIKMIHPAVIQQTGRKVFDTLFDRLRKRTKPVKSIELESFKVELSEKGNYSFTITYLVTGRSGPIEYSAKFQRDGLKIAMTGLEIAEHPINPSDSEPLAPAPAPPVPSAPPMLTRDSLAPSSVKPTTPVPAPESSSSNANNNTSTWKETVSIEDRVSFRMPGKAERSKKSDDLFYTFALPNKAMTFELEITPMDPDVIKDSSVFFKAYRGLLVQKYGVEVLVEKFRTHNGFPEQSLLLRMKGGKFATIRNIMDGNINYRATWIGPDMSDDSREYAIPFVDSIKLINEDGVVRTGQVANAPNGNVVLPTTPSDDDLPAAPRP